MPGLTERVRDVCARAVAALDGDAELVAEAEAIARRLDEPLRLAIAGRAKAGKSTLLNALVGELLAATDAAECTRVVTWYREGIVYGAEVVLDDGSKRPVMLRRDEVGRVSIDLGGVAAGDAARIDISWPSSQLRTVTLIDTPGLESVHDEVSARTRDFLAPDDGSADADAVVYLMRHLHERDAEFLESFADRSLAIASPANAVAVLSRADEIGACRPDALVSARRIADRYEADPQVGALVGAVVPVAGLLAETAATLAEHEAGWLRQLAALDAPQVEALLESVQRFVGIEDCPLAPEVRSDLLDRFGLFGIRFCVAALRDGTCATASDLERAMLEVSGLPALRRLVQDRFVRQAAGLKARSVLASLRALARRAGHRGAALEALVEEAEASSPELLELRVLTLVLAGATRLDAAEGQEAVRALTATTDAGRVGAGEHDEPSVLATAALAGAERWRTLGADPVHDPLTVEVCDIVARVHERIYLGAVQG